MIYEVDLFLKGLDTKTQGTQYTYRIINSGLEAVSVLVTHR